MTAPSHRFDRLLPDRREYVLAVLLFDVFEPARYVALVADWRAGTLSLEGIVAEAPLRMASR